MIKKILLVLGISIALFAGVNTVAALNSSILDAISGLPLSDQVLFIAKEVDRLKLKDELRDVCDEVSRIINRDGTVTFGGYTYKSMEDAERYVVQLGGLPDGTPASDFYAVKAKYDQAKADCDRLTEEFNQKYGE